MVQIVRTFRIAGQREKGQSLTGTRFGFLQQLHDGEARMSDLAAKLLVSAAVASRTIDSLAAEGLVERRTDPRDARASLVSITDRGKAMMVESQDQAVRRFATALSDWSPADAQSAVSLLKRLNVHVAELTQLPDSDV